MKSDGTGDGDKNNGSGMTLKGGQLLMYWAYGLGKLWVFKG
jgi:hypothetical protein